MRKGIHVVPREGGWAVRREHAEHASSHHHNQAEAIQAGKKLAQAGRSELVIHGRDGKIREKNSYGNDPFPPQG